jgi:hypothetical protein
MGTLHEDQYTLFIKPRLVLLRMRSVLVKICRSNQNTHFKFHNSFHNIAVYEIICRNVREPDGPQMTIWCMFDACWITNAVITHSEYVIIIAFPLQQRLHECNSVSHYSTQSGCR